MGVDLTTNKIEALSGLKELWRETLGDPRICIAVLDGPVDLTHPSLKGAKLNRIETLVQGEADQGPASKHGTHISSVIFGQHDGPIKGIAPNCRGLIVPIFRDGVNGSISACSQLDLARAIQDSVQEGAQIINISGGEFSPSGTAHPILSDTIRQAAESGVLIIAATGNEGCECLHVPGALPLVLPVGAMSWGGNPLEFSNWGETYQTRGILAPGENILGAAPGGGIVRETGTSYAVPIVSGIAALLFSIQLKNEKKIDTKTVHACLLDSAIGCDVWPVLDCRKLLRGRVNVPQSVHCLHNQLIHGKEKSMIDSESQELEGTLSMNKVFSEGIQPSELKPEVTEDEVLSATTTKGKSIGNGFEKIMQTPENVKGVSACVGCGGSPCSCSTQVQPKLVFAIGQLGIDFGSETRLNSFAQNMTGNPHDTLQILEQCEKCPSDAAAIHWTLNIDSTPIYAVQPQGPFSSDVYQCLREFLKEQVTEGVERVSIPGVAGGGIIRLLSGQNVPILAPDLRGMNNWTTNALVEAVCGKAPTNKELKGKNQDTYTEKIDGVRNFLERVYHELRNLGISPQDRAVNYSATNALNSAGIFEVALKDHMQLDTIEVEQSPICNPGADCWDVKLTFFDPNRQLERARKVYRFTVDVSDVCPVMVGAVRSWFIR